MSLIAKGTNKEFKPTPEGNHMARCYRVIDLGTQAGEWEGKPTLNEKVLIAWELFGEDDDGTPMLMDDGRPFTTSKTYTNFLSKKSKLRADIESWRGRAFTDEEIKGFDLSKLLGVYCMVTIKHDKVGDKTYANVAAVAKWPSALKNSKPDPVNESQMFDVMNPDMRVFEVLPDWIKEKINACLEWQKKDNPEPVKRVTNTDSQEHAFEDMDSDIPF